MSDDDDRPRDASSAADPTWADFVIPDDIRDLAADIEAYRRERRRAIWRTRWQRVTRYRGVVPALVVTAALLIAGLVATLLTVLAPTTVQSNTTALPLANPSARPGTVGGLLPETMLQGAIDGPTNSSALRPAVIALVTVHCNCTSLLGTIAEQAYSVNLPLTVVVPALSDPDAASLPADLGRYDTVDVLYDGDATLASTFHPRGVTVVLVRRDGRISDIQRAVTAATAKQRLDAPLQTLLLPEATFS
jgi:hypothetical protein